MLGKTAWEEGVAIGFLREIGEPAPPVDAFELAYAAGLSVRYGSPARTDGKTIYVPRKLEHRERHWLVAHELGHVLLGWSEMQQNEGSADAIGAALLVPRASLVDDIRRGLTVDQIIAKHANAPERIVRQRITWVSSD
jgi:hypothetical protein